MKKNEGSIKIKIYQFVKILKMLNSQNVRPKNKLSKIYCLKVDSNI